MGIDDALDILILVIVLAILAPIMIADSVPLFKGDVGGFNTLIEKTSQETASEIVPQEQPLTADDVILMSVVADAKEPKPARISTQVDLNMNGVVETNEVLPMEFTIQDILQNRDQVRNTLASFVTRPDNAPLKLETVVDGSGMERWVVSCE